MNHNILLDRLRSVGLSDNVVSWFTFTFTFMHLADAFIQSDLQLHSGYTFSLVYMFNTYLKGRTQCVQVDGIKSDLLGVGTGVPQGSVLGPLLFIIYINCLDVNIDNTRFHFYANDTVIYCSAPTKQQALVDLQSTLYTPTTVCPLTAPPLLSNLRMILWFWASSTTMTRPHTWMRWRDLHHGARTTVSL